jgi:hypothetical protein
LQDIFYRKPAGRSGGKGRKERQDILGLAELFFDGNEVDHIFAIIFQQGVQGILIANHSETFPEAHRLFLQPSALSNQASARTCKIFIF